MGQSKQTITQKYIKEIKETSGAGGNAQVYVNLEIQFHHQKDIEEKESS